jgi:hypothetical protein
MLNHCHFLSVPFPLVDTFDVCCYQIQRDYVVFSLDVYSQKVYAIVFCRTPSREQYVYDYSLANVVCHLKMHTHMILGEGQIKEIHVNMNRRGQI